MASEFVLDKTLILNRLGGDEEIFSMMLDMYLQDVEQNSADIAAALASGDVAVLQRQLHTIKGLLATFSDDVGAESALALEQRAKTCGLSGLDDAVGALQARLYEVADVLKAEIRLPG